MDCLESLTDWIFNDVPFSSRSFGRIELAGLKSLKYV